MANRSQRLLELMQALRRRRRPVTAQVLAEELGISKRSLYRDIDTLKSMGAVIDGEPGLGFQLRADVFLPPLMFSEEEMEALVLGLRGLIYGPDAAMSRTARDATAKINAVLPPERRGEMESIGLFAMPKTGAAEDGRLSDVRRALREEVAIRIAYRDGEGRTSDRTIYPVALAYFDNRQVLVAWCTLRNDYRSFRIDGMTAIEMTETRLPEPRRTLFHRWHTAHNLPDLT